MRSSLNSEDGPSGARPFEGEPQKVASEPAGRKDLKRNLIRSARVPALPGSHEMVFMG